MGPEVSYEASLSSSPWSGFLVGESKSRPKHDARQEQHPYDTPNQLAEKSLSVCHSAKLTSASGGTKSLPKKMRASQTSRPGSSEQGKPVLHGAFGARRLEPTPRSSRSGGRLTSCPSSQPSSPASLPPSWWPSLALLYGVGPHRPVRSRTTRFSYSRSLPRSCGTYSTPRFEP